MTSDMEKTPPEQSGATSTTLDHTTKGDAGLATELLRALLYLPARQVLETLDRIDKRDLHAEQARTILAAVDRQARDLVDAGTPDTPVHPVSVQLDLQARGDLSQQAVRDLLIQVSTGDPVPPQMLPELIIGLRFARLRRAFIVTGNSLVDAATASSHDDMARALAHAQWLFELARRVGFGGEANAD